MWFDVILDVVWPPVSGLLYALMRSRYGGDFRGRTYVMWGYAAAWDIGIGLIAALWLPVIVSAANLILAAWLYWRHGRRKDRAPRAYGAKSRALLAAIVRRAREAAKPRPVLRPVPQGIR